MAKLTAEQLQFLQAMDIPLSRVFDASGCSTPKYKRVMKSLDMWIAYGVTPCERKGHTLRTRSGHCAQCRTAGIAYLIRHDMPANVYVAWSEKGQVSKVGLSIETGKRVQNLNSYSYGGQSDWRDVFVLHCARAGKVEALVHHNLAAYAQCVTYYSSGYAIECRELFRCSKQMAIDSVKDAARAIEGNEKPSAKSAPIAQHSSPPAKALVPESLSRKRNTSVAQYATELKIPPMAMVEQLTKAGVVKQSSADTLSEQDKTRLLNFLRTSHGGTASKAKITLTRKAATEIKAADSTGKTHTIQVEVRKKRIFVKRDTEATVEIPADSEIEIPVDLQKPPSYQNSDKDMIDLKRVEVTVTPCNKNNASRKPVEQPVAGSKLDYVWPRHKDLTPFEHQLRTTEFLVEHSRAFCLNDMGTAKTLSVLWAYDYLRRQGIVQSMLVVCPLSTMQLTWADEIEKNFRRILRYKILHGDRSERMRALSEKADIYIINPDGLHKVSGMVDAFASRPDINMVVVDEIAQCARNAGTSRFKALNAIVNKQVPRRAFGLTGTPIPNQPTDAWAQCRLLVPEKVPPYFNRFRDEAMVQTRGGWVPRKDALEKVKSAMQPSIRYERDQCLDLPDCVFERRSVELGKVQQRLYDQMLRWLHTEFDGKEIDAPNEMVKTLKLLQIACGAPYTINGDVAFPPMPERLAIVDEIVEEAAGKVIVFVPFRGAIEAVCKHLEGSFARQGLNSAVATIHGGVAVTKRGDIFHRFQDGDDIRVLVAQAQAMSHGLTLTVANTIIWFGPTTSADTYTQANARISRIGQKNRQFIIQIEGCEVERRIFHRLREKGKLQGLLLELLTEKFGTRARPKGHFPAGYEVVT